MLFQITNKCLMGCPDCMDDSSPNGGMMSRETFSKALSFAKDNGEVHILISGGEPTEHPCLVDFCKEINNTHIHFSIASNGMWLGDSSKEWNIEKISMMRNFLAGQIYSNPKWYRLHEDTCRRYEESRGKWTAMKWTLDTCDIRAMSDIGRARLNDRVRDEAYSSTFHNMCLTACVTAAQVDSLPDFFHMMFMQQRFCTPMVDYKGDIHMSESCLCPSIGCNVNTHTNEQIWGAMKLFRPCGGCTPCRRFMEEQTPKMVTHQKCLRSINSI